jgi:acylphosphatase
LARLIVQVERRTILFSGRVQGVGFRMTTIQLAQGLPLAGEVKNLPDGQVELTVHGAPRDIDVLLARLREHFEGFIRNIHQDRFTSESPAPGGSGIRIVH